MAKFKLPKGRRPNQPWGSATDWDRLQTWAQSLMMREGPHLRTRVAIVDGGRFQEWDVTKLLGGPTSIEYTYQVASVLARGASPGALVAVIMTFTPGGMEIPLWKGPPCWLSWIVARSKDGAFHQRWWRLVPDHVRISTESHKARIEADFLAADLYVDPGIDDALAAHGVAGAIRRVGGLAPNAADPAADAPLTARAPVPAPVLREDWESLRTHSEEINNLAPAAHLPSPAAIPGGAPPFNAERRTFEDLAANGWTNASQATFLAFPCSEQRDLRAAVATLEALPGFPAGALGFALSRAAQTAALVRRDVPLAMELALRFEGHMATWTTAAGGAEAWLAEAWPESPSLEHRHLGSVAVACLATWMGWRAVRVHSSWKQDEEPLDAYEARCAEIQAEAERLRDHLLGRAGFDGATPGARIVAASRRLLRVVASVHGETDEVRWRDAAFEAGRTAESAECLADVAAWHAARLHSTLTMLTSRLALIGVWATDGARPHVPEHIDRDGLFQWALDVVARLCVLEAARIDDPARAVALLDHARRLVPANPAVLACANEGRFRLGAHTAELLRDLGSEGGPKPELAVAAEQLAVAEAVRDAKTARRASRRLRELAPRSPHRWAIDVRLAFRTPGALSSLDAVAALAAGAPPEALDTTERAVQAVYGDDPSRAALDWRAALEARRDTLLLAAQIGQERVEDEETRPTKPSRPPAPTRVGPGAVLDAIEAIRWRIGRQSLFKSALRKPLEAHARAALELLDDEAFAPAQWITAIGDPAVGLVPALDAGLVSQSWEATTASLAIADEALEGTLAVLWTVRTQRKLASVRPGLTGNRPGEAALRGRANALVERIAAAATRPLRMEVGDAVTALQIAAAELRDVEDEDPPEVAAAEAPRGFRPMYVSTVAVERSARELGTPAWALQTGLRLVTAFNAARGHRFVQSLKGTRDERGLLMELKQVKSHPVRVFFRYVTGGPRVVAIWDKDDDAHQQQVIDLVRTWEVE